MHPQFKKGIYGGLLVYSIILVITYILYLKFPRQGHAPAIYFLVLIGLFYISIAWAILNLLLIIIKKTRMLGLGMISINSIYILFCLIWLLIFNLNH